MERNQKKRVIFRSVACQLFSFLFCSFLFRFQKDKTRFLIIGARIGIKPNVIGRNRVSSEQSTSATKRSCERERKRETGERGSNIDDDNRLPSHHPWKSGIRVWSTTDRARWQQNRGRPEHASILSISHGRERECLWRLKTHQRILAPYHR